MTQAEEFAQLLFTKLGEARDRAAKYANSPGKLSKDQWLAIVSKQTQALLDAPKKKRAKGERNVIMDALALAMDLKLDQIGPSRWKRLGVALADIRAAMPAVTPDEIKRRAEKYRSKFKDWLLTETSLAMHWSELGGGPRTQSEKLNIYAEPPAGWRVVAHRLFPKAKDFMSPIDFDSVAWLDVSSTIRPDILRAML